MRVRVGMRARVGRVYACPAAKESSTEMGKGTS